MHIHAHGQTEGAGSVRRTKRTFLLLANFMPFVLVICAALIAYAMQLNGVAIDVVGKVPQVSKASGNSYL